jgi:hypothetical protein
MIRFASILEFRAFALPGPLKSSFDPRRIPEDQIPGITTRSRLL